MQQEVKLISHSGTISMYGVYVRVHVCMCMSFYVGIFIYMQICVYVDMCVYIMYIILP